MLPRNQIRFWEPDDRSLCPFQVLLPWCHKGQPMAEYYAALAMAQLSQHAQARREARKLWDGELPWIAKSRHRHFGSCQQVLSQSTWETNQRLARTMLILSTLCCTEQNGGGGEAVTPRFLHVRQNVARTELKEMLERAVNIVYWLYQEPSFQLKLSQPNYAFRKCVKKWRLYSPIWSD